MENQYERNELPSYFKEGLSSEEVAKLTEEGKINKVKSATKNSILKIICKNLFTFFNFLLFTIAIILIIFQQWSNLVFMVVVLANLALGLIQDLRAKHMVDQLSFINKSKYVVIRDGKENKIYDEELVLGDILILRGSEIVPCDCKVFTGDCYVNESMLTGETDKIKKVVGDKLFSGTYLTSGEVYVLIEKVGNDSYINKLSNKTKEFKAPKSKLFTQITAIFKILSIIVAILGILQIIVVWYTNIGFNGNIKVGYWTISKEVVAPICGALISMIPSGMYLLFSTSLMAGVIELSVRHVLVNEMYSLDMLARADVLCIDKTGTITTGNMQVSKVKVFPNSYFNENELHVALANVNAAIKDANTTAVALKNYFGSETRYKVKKIIHFDSSYKYSGASFEEIGTIIIGAYGFFKVTNDSEELKEKISKASANGERILMVAHSTKEIIGETLPNDLKFIGVIVIEDEIKSDAKEIIKWFRRNDVIVKVISGDNELTVKNIALKVDLEGADKCVSLNNKDDDFIENNVENYNVYGRVSPEQKKTIVEALRKNGHVVAMFGDGVNDILAFKSADVSISVANGSNAAKDLASLILTDNNFSGLPDVVSQGRRVINNLQRTCSIFLVKTAFSMILNTFFLIYGLFTGISWPFVPGSFYAWELCSIGIASFLLALEPNSERIKGNFIKNILQNALPPGVLISVVVALLYILAYTLNFNKLYSLDEASLRSISTWFISIFGLIVLFEVCLPFNLYRIIVFFAAFILACVIFIWTIFGTNWLNLEGDVPRILSNVEGAILGIMVAISITIMIVIWLIKYFVLNRKINKGFVKK